MSRSSPNTFHRPWLELWLVFLGIVGGSYLYPLGSAPPVTPDLCVYGATPAGIAAAVSAGRAGMRVTMVEPTSRVGGMMTSGLSHSDFRSFESLSGFFGDFARRVEQHYIDAYGANSAQAKGCWRGTHGEPKMNLQIFEQLLAEQNVQVLTAHTLVGVETSAWKSGRCARDGRIWKWRVI